MKAVRLHEFHQSPVVDDVPEPKITGAPVADEAIPLHLRRARTTRISIEANGGICRGMLRHRYETAGLGEEEDSEGRPDTWLSPAARRR